MRVVILLYIHWYSLLNVQGSQTHLNSIAITMFPVLFQKKFYLGESKKIVEMEDLIYNAIDIMQKDQCNLWMGNLGN